MKIIEKLNQLNQRSRQFIDEPIDRDLYNLLTNTELLKLAYDNIKSQPSHLTPGIVNETLDSMSNEAIQELANKLKDESFQFRTARRTLIPNQSGKMIPIVPKGPQRDTIVQEAMRIILNAIYEPCFMEQSHG